jgi:hypothetical protein
MIYELMSHRDQVSLLINGERLLVFGQSSNPNLRVFGIIRVGFTLEFTYNQPFQFQPRLAYPSDNWYSIRLSEVDLENDNG